MKISHGLLETARKNPAGFLKSLSRGSFGGLSAFRIWQFASRKVHRSSLGEAQKHLEKVFWKNLKQSPRNARIFNDLKYRLNEYSVQFNSLKHEIITLGDKFTLEILKGISFGGEIPRVDLKSHAGYAIILFIKEAYEWEAELRMPLIQMAYSKKLGSPLEEISVGIYCLKNNKYEFKTFSSRDVKKAMEEATNLAHIIKGD